MGIEDSALQSVNHRADAERDRADSLQRQLEEETSRRTEAEKVVRRVLRIGELRAAEAVADADAMAYAARWLR